MTITAANADAQKDKLTPGQLALFKAYPTYKMIVYPTRRSAAFPQAHYDETMANPPKAKLAPGGNGVVGTNGGVAFPVPKNGNEGDVEHAYPLSRRHVHVQLEPGGRFA
jgi:hypothetical protein